MGVPPLKCLGDVQVLGLDGRPCVALVDFVRPRWRLVSITVVVNAPHQRSTVLMSPAELQIDS